MMTSVMEINPPPPKPCMERPISIWVKFWAQLATIVPTRKDVKAISRIGFLPNMLDNEAKLG